MGDSIFEFADKFGYQSPFGNWLKVIPEISITLTNIELTIVNKQERYSISLTVKSNLDLPSATLFLLTSNERSGALTLSKTINVTKIESQNNFTIAITKDAFELHSKNATPNSLLLYLQLVHASVTNPVKSTSFEMKWLELKLSGLKVTWKNADKKTKSVDDLLTFSYSIRTLKTTSTQVGVRMIQDKNGIVDEFLPERFSANSTVEKPPKMITLTDGKASGTLGVYRKVIDERKKTGNQFYIQAYLDSDRARTAVLDFEKEFSDELKIDEGCGIEYRELIQCTRYTIDNKFLYGPVYWGDFKMGNYTGWGQLIAAGTITESDKNAIVAMSENEGGKLDTVQAYDDMPLTVGVMQKIVDLDGKGEFTKQLYQFSLEFPQLYTSLFVDCGWTVVGTSASNAKTYYKNITGLALKNLLRTTNFNESTFGKKVPCPPLEPLIRACLNSDFQSKQVDDFITRLNESMNLKPINKDYKIKDYVKSELGKALVLDQSVNRPNHVQGYFSEALDRLFIKLPSISKNPNNWGSKHSSYELMFTEIYGPLRHTKLTYAGNEMKGMTDGVERYLKLKKKLTVN